MDALKQTGQAGNPTYESYYTKLIVDKLIDDVVHIVDEFDRCMQKIAKAVDKTEKWNHRICYTRIAEGMTLLVWKNI